MKALANTLEFVIHLTSASSLRTESMPIINLPRSWNFCRQVVMFQMIELAPVGPKHQS